MEKKCKNCGESYSVKPSHYHKSSYCSRECMASGYKDRLRGKDNPNYKNAGAKICTHCGSEFSNYNKTQKYCSMSCARKATVDKDFLDKIRPSAISAWKEESAKRRRYTQKKLSLKFDSRKRCVCLVCSKEFYSYQSRDTCSKQCANEHSKKIVVRSCVACGKEMTVRPSDVTWRHYLTCSPQCKSEWQARRQKGEKSHLWKGGKTSEAMIIRTSLEYDQWRKRVFKRDDYTCHLCKRKGGKLTAHHIKPFSTHPDLHFVLGNGITLCWPCHTTIRGKEAEYEEEFFASTGGIV